MHYLPEQGDPWETYDPDAWISFVAAVVRRALGDHRAAPTNGDVTKQHRETAEQFLKRHGFLREDGSLGPPLDT